MNKPISTQEYIAEIIDNGPVSSQQILVVLLCLILNMLDGFDITAMAVVAGAVAEELVLSPDKLGWIFSVALAGMMAGAMFLAPLSDLIGRRLTIIIAVILIAVSILLTARATSLAEFLVLRLVSGIGAGAMLATQAALASEYSSEKYRALSVALVTSGYPLGAVMTSLVAGIIMPEYGWRGMFLAGGLATLLVGIIAWLLLPESLKYLLERRPANALQKTNIVLARMRRETLSELPEISSAAKSEKPGSRGFIATLSALFSAELRGKTIILWTVFFLSFSTLYFLMSWIPKLFEDAGHGVASGRQAFFYYNLGGVLGVYLLGALSLRFRLNHLIGTLQLIAAAGMLYFALVPGSLDAMMLLILLIGITHQGGFTGLYSAATKIYPTHCRSTGIGWAVGLGRSGAVAGPAAAGYLIAAGISMSGNFVAFAIPLAIAALLSYRIAVR